MRRKYHVGDVYPTNCGVDARITATEGFGRQYVEIEWLDEFSHVSVVKSTHLNAGKVYNPYARSMRGIGYTGVGDYLPSVGGKRTLEYDTWKGVFQRCYDEKHHEKYPTYSDCTLSDKWICFQDFAAWANKQVGWGLPKWHLDKDLLVKGNKLYGPDTCIMLPERLNMLIINRSFFRGEYPIGVHWDSGRSKFKGQYKEFDGSLKSERFDNVDEAFCYYKNNRERVIKEAAELYKSQIDPRAYEALLSWEISIDD